MIAALARAWRWLAGGARNAAWLVGGALVWWLHARWLTRRAERAEDRAAQAEATLEAQARVDREATNRDRSAAARRRRLERWGLR